MYSYEGVKAGMTNAKYTHAPLILIHMLYAVIREIATFEDSWE